MKKMIAVFLIVCSQFAFAQTATYPNFLLAWDYPTNVADLRGFVCRVGARIIGQAGPGARSMRLNPPAEGVQNVVCTAVGVDDLVSADATLSVDYDANPSVTPPGNFCRVLSGGGSTCEITWTYATSAREFSLFLDGDLVGKAGPNARAIECPTITGSQTLGILALSDYSVPSAIVTIDVADNDADGSICSE
jgi:hypothetical protein